MDRPAFFGDIISDQEFKGGIPMESKNIKKAAFLSSALALISALGTYDVSAQENQVNKETVLRNDMRKLWADHVIWTREYITKAVAGHPQAKPVSERLLRNQDEIGAAIVPYYGKEAGDKLAQLLREHIQIATEVVDAAKKNKKAKLEDADKRWHANAKEIAVFLASANPHWQEENMTGMLNDHLSLTTQETVYQINKKWQDDIGNFDKIFEQALMMADDLSRGILKQFPEKFKSNGDKS